MKLRESDAVRSGAIGPDKQRQKMFVDLDGEIAEALLVLRLELGATSQMAVQHPAAHADVDAVVGEADVGQAGQHDQFVGDDAGFAQLGHGIQLAAAQRSEERRVGKECRSRWSPYHYKKHFK